MPPKRIIRIQFDGFLEQPLRFGIILFGEAQKEGKSASDQLIGVKIVRRTAKITRSVSVGEL